MKAFGWMFLLGSMSLSGFAQEFKWTHYGLRPLGMGNAYVAVADDFNSLFYNPAGLARLKEWDGEFLNPKFDWSTNTSGFMSKAMDLSSGEGGSDVTSVLNLLNDESGNNHHLGVGLTPHLIFKHFGFGLGLDIDANMVFQRHPSVFLDIGPRVVFPISFAMNFLEERLSIGFSLKARARGGVYHDFSIQDIEAFTKKGGEKSDSDPKLDDFVEGGWGVGYDFGLLFTPMKPMEPTLGLSVSDIGGTPYKAFSLSGKNKLGAPKPAPPTINSGISLKPYQTPWSYILTSVDVHGINLPMSFTKKLNLGVEWGYSQIIKVQMGSHQGYATGGFQFDVGLINMRLITYAVELSPSAGTVMDRRYAFQLKMLI